MHLGNEILLKVGLKIHIYVLGGEGENNFEVNYILKTIL